MFTVRVGTPDPRFGNMLLEQFGGANGELAAAMQYSIQGLNCDDPGLKDLLMDIGTEELSHLEVIGTLAKLHLKPTKKSREAAETNKSFGSHLDIRHFASHSGHISTFDILHTWSCASGWPEVRGCGRRARHWESTTADAGESARKRAVPRP
jgi:Mn-containing catalase